MELHGGIILTEDVTCDELVNMVEHGDSDWLALFAVLRKFASEYNKQLLLSAMIRNDYQDWLTIISELDGWDNEEYKCNVFLIMLEYWYFKYQRCDVTDEQKTDIYGIILEKVFTWKNKYLESLVLCGLVAAGFRDASILENELEKWNRDLGEISENIKMAKVTLVSVMNDYFYSNRLMKKRN